MALSGATTDFQGSLFQVGGFKLALDRPKRKIPIYIAALGPKMLRLAGKIADGVLLYLWSLPTIPTAISEVRKGAEEVGRSLDNFEVATVLPVAVSENRREAQAIIARAIAYYVGGMGTYYRRVISQSAFASEASKITEEWQRGDRVSATKAVTERLIDSVAVAGSVTHCGRKLEQFASKGMTLPILSPSIEGANAAMRFCQTIKSLVAN
jgi:alkanesulfonate monooxygenase SsuD/methylene tetrahydromethanopterin reductase-like flavin-dependent oxidoreductase (luciferase family)